MSGEDMIAEAKARAIQLIDLAIDLIAESGVPLDGWQRAHLIEAIDHLHRGMYDAAAFDAVDARVLPLGRNAAVKIPPYGENEELTLDRIRAALDEAQHRPLERWPIFGPILFGRPN